MTPDQIPQLLKQVSYADPRMLPEDPAEVMGMAALWATVLTDVPTDYAMQAVGEHYARSPFPIKPSDIANRWATTVRDRMDRHTGTFEPTAHPELDPDDIPGYQAALRAERQAVATGAAEPVKLRELTPGPDAEVERRLQELGDYVPRHVRDLLAEYRPLRAERERLAREGQPDPLNVDCEWCGARENQPCRSQRRDPHTNTVAHRPRTTPHPSRIDAASLDTARDSA